MNLDYLHAAKVVSDFLQSDDSAYEAAPDVAFESGKSIISALQEAGFVLTHRKPADWDTICSTARGEP